MPIDMGGFPGAVSVGSVIGYAYTLTATTATNAATAIPYDNTIPQSGEGDAFASLDTTYTPLAASSLLEVTLVLNISASTFIDVTAALFRDADANAIGTNINTITGTNYSRALIVTTVVAAGSTSATTFKVRWGRSGSTAYINRAATANLFNGTYVSSLTVREIKQ